MLERLPIDNPGPHDTFVDSRGLSLDERVALAFRLGDEACRAHADFHGISLEEAAVRLRARRQIGRIPLFADTPQDP